MTYDELYSNYEYEEIEIKLALKSIINNEEVVNEAAMHYQMGRRQDLVHAEQMLSKGASFNAVDKTLRSNIKKRCSSRPNWDQKLRKALINSKGLPDVIYTYEAHHIVAKGDQRAKQAVEILFALGIDIDSPDNGVFLPKGDKSKNKGVYKSAYKHENIHTNAYYANVNFQIVSAFENGADKEDVKSLLRDIGEDLQQGRYPIHQYIPGAE